jgi:hypothetical protein
MSQWARSGLQDHRGRSLPRSYRRADLRIYEDVCDRLTDARDIDATEIEVSVQDGEVSLRGTVGDRAMRRRAEDIAQGVGGVQHVENDIRIRARLTTSMTGDHLPTRATSRTAVAAAPEADPPRTVAALFESVEEAERAAHLLQTAGHATDRLSIARREETTGTEPETGQGLLATLKSLFLPQADQDAYAEGVRRGGALLTVTTTASKADEVKALLQGHGAVDLETRRQT